MTGTPLARLRHKNKWIDYCETLLDAATTVRKSADRLGVHRCTRGAVHIQDVNACHRRMRDWLEHFRGVATRYLGNYCGWRRAIDGPRIDSPEAFLRAAVGVFRT